MGHGENLKVAHLIEEEVFWLEVAVDYRLVVQVRKRRLYAARIEARLRLVEAMPLAEDRKQLATFHQ